MISRVKIFFLIGFATLMFASCKDDEPFVDPVPSIRIESLSSANITQFVDDLVITISYEDGDGDLGFHNPDSIAIFVWDSRLVDPETFHLPPVAPPDQELITQGNIDIRLHSVFLLGNGASETVNYTVQIRDRAGNFSNKVVSENVVISR